MILCIRYEIQGRKWNGSSLIFVRKTAQPKKEIPMLSLPTEAWNKAPLVTAGWQVNCDKTETLTPKDKEKREPTPFLKFQSEKQAQKCFDV